MAELTAEQVLEAMSQPLDVLEDGQVRCRLCPRVVASRQALAPHMLKHRRAVGLAPPRGGTTGRSDITKRVPRPCPQCNKMMRSDNLRRHLMVTHGLSPRAASDEAYRPPPPLVVAGQAEEPSVLTDITAIEAVTGILSAARSDGVIPTRLLPSAFNLANHVEAVLDELRRLTERNKR